MITSNNPVLSVIAAVPKTTRLTVGLAILLAPAMAFAGGGGDAHAIHLHMALMFLGIACIYLVGSMGNAASRLGLPPVVGQIVFGAALGFGWRAIDNHTFQLFVADSIVLWCSHVAVNLLLFEAGLEENIAKVKAAFGRAFVIALVGVILPAAAGYFVCAWFFPKAESATLWFFAATSVATSVGINVELFKGLGYTGKARAMVVYAGVFDDIKGLIALSVVVAMAAGEPVTFGMVGGKIGIAIAAMVAAVVVGALTAKSIGLALSKAHPGEGMKLAFALVVCSGMGLLFFVGPGMEPIIGSFVAGLFLDPVAFDTFRSPGLVEKFKGWKQKATPELAREIEEEIHAHEHGHVEDLVKGLSRFLVPIFFVLVGMQVDVSVLLSWEVILPGVVTTIVAILGKLACGLFAGPGVNKWVVAWAMVIRGEVGLVFAAVGKGLGVFDETTFAVLIFMIVATTILPPLVIPGIIKREKAMTTS